MHKAARTSNKKVSACAGRLSRSSLMMQGSILAASTFALATWATDDARAQAVAPVAVPTSAAQGTPAFAQGTGSVFEGQNNTAINVDQAETIINWSTFDNAAIDADPRYINFLPADASLSFNGDFDDYVVLNRVFSTPSNAGDHRGIAFLGDVRSFSFGEGTGGDIWFYSPGGILVGSTASFNVGSLMLTTSDVNAISGDIISFGGVTDPNSSVIIRNGATIDALNANGYVAVWAPRVEQGGNVNVAGAAAYVAGESGTLTINSGGLFNIAVTVGSEDANGIVHTGNTLLNQDGTNTAQLVAVPKNDAISMLVGGQVAVATSATSASGTIVLSADDPADSFANSIMIGPGTFDASPGGFIRFASDAVNLAASGVGNDINLRAGIVVLQAGSAIDIAATSSANVQVVGDLLATAVTDGVGGTISISVDDAGRDSALVASGLQVSGNARFSTSAIGAEELGTGAVGGDASGGRIDLDINTGGDLIVTGSLDLDASAMAGYGDGQAGAADGGSVDLQMTGANSRIRIDNQLTVDTSANPAIVSDTSTPTPAPIGSSSTAGDASLSFTGGNSLIGSLIVTSFAEASSGTDSSVAQSNDAFAGDVAIALSGGTHQFGNIDIDAHSNTGFSFNDAGEFAGGMSDHAVVSLSLDSNAQLTLVDGMMIDASTEGTLQTAGDVTAVSITASGNSSLFTPVTSIGTAHNNRESGAESTSGSILLSSNGSGLDLGDLDLDTGNTTLSTALARTQNRNAGNITLTAAGGGSITGSGGSLNAEVTEITSADGPAVYTGGDVGLIADGGSISFTDDLTIDTSVDVPRGGDMTGLVSTGGDVLVRQVNDGTGIALTFVDIDTSATGSDESNGFVGDGGNAAGGDVIFDQQAEDFSAGSINISTRAQGHIGGFQVDDVGDIAGDGGSAAGGNVTFDWSGNGFIADDISIDAVAKGGDGGDGEFFSGSDGAGTGGAAAGGDITLLAQAGTVAIGTTLSLNAGASAGYGGFGSGIASGVGGDATGGTIIYNQTGADLTVGTTNLIANVSATGGYGGSAANRSGELSFAPGGPGNAGGAGTGGDVLFTFSAGSNNFTSLDIQASGTGGDGGNFSESFGPQNDGGEDRKSVV